MSKPGLETSLNERAQLLLKTLVERYIRDGQPVGSRTLSRDTGLSLSPATIRNVMADLEDLGLLASPHTSAGRVPTALGYRLFVDTLIQIEPLDEAGLHRQIAEQLSGSRNSRALIQSASNLLSDITQLAGVVMVPKQGDIRLRQVEFLPLSNNQVLVILVVNNKEVHNRIINTDREYSAAELEQAANYLNKICAGKDLASMRDNLIDDLRKTHEHMNETMVAAIRMAEQAFSSTPQEEVLVSGQTNLMDYGELGDMEKLRQLFDAFSRKRDILHLLDQSLTASGVQIFIGEESGYEIFDQCSVVTAPCENEGNVLGVLGVVGPTRMAYDRVIPIVDVTARILGAALNQRQ